MDVSAWLRDPKAKQVFRLFGWAGTGKSTLARHLTETEDCIKTVEYMAFTGKAALVMQNAGCDDAGTIHSKIYKVKKKKDGTARYVLDKDSPVHNCDLIIVDEVSMVDENLASDVLSFGKKVLVLGDPFQLPPVRGTGFFTEVKPDIMLTEIHRQAADNPIIRMSMDVREGRGLQYGSYGNSKVINKKQVDQSEVMSADQILVGLNKSRINFNDRVRQLKKLPPNKPAFGDKLVCLRNNHMMGLLNGQIWNVKAIKNYEENIFKMSVKPDDDVKRKHARVVSVHDFFFCGRESELSHLDLKGLQQFTFGYALTVHKSQGSQWNDLYLFDESGAFREHKDRHLYTGITRSAEKVTVVR